MAHSLHVGMVLAILLMLTSSVSALTPPPRECVVILDVCTIAGSDVVYLVPQEANIEVWVDYDNDREKDSGELAGCRGTEAVFMVQEGNLVSYSVSADGFLPCFDSFYPVDLNGDDEIFVSVILKPCVAPIFYLYLSGCYSQSELMLGIDTSYQFGIHETSLVAQEGHYSEPLFVIWSPVGSVRFSDVDASQLGLDYDVFVYVLEDLDSPTTFRWGFDAFRENITLYAALIEGTVIPPEGLQAVTVSSPPPYDLTPMNVTLDGQTDWMFVFDYYFPCLAIPSIDTWPPYIQTLNPPTTSPLTPPIADLSFLSNALLALAGAGAFFTLLWIGILADQRSARRHCHVWHEVSVGNKVYHICERCGRTERQITSWHRMRQDELADLARRMLQREG